MSATKTETSRLEYLRTQERNFLAQAAASGRQCWVDAYAAEAEVYTLAIEREIAILSARGAQ